jgi:hypothetical protein
MHQRLPELRISGIRTQQKDLDLASEVFRARRVLLAYRKRAHARAVAVEPRREHFGIVQHQAIAGTQELRQLAERAVFPTLAVAVQHQHARSRAIFERVLCDGLFRQAIIEV